MKKKNIYSEMKKAKRAMSEKMANDNKDVSKNVSKKTSHISQRERYKALRESSKEENVLISNTYEEDLIKSLFPELEGESVVNSEVKNDTEEVKVKEQPRKSSKWDYTLDDEITFFDPECSYELTKYRPITETKGLDFNPEWFTEAARTYEETGKYTEYPQGSKPYADYWIEQLRRCSEGYEVNGYRLTPDHYFFLNFYRMNIVDETKKAASGDSEGFPKFLVEQYKFFHYFELCEHLKKDVVALKSRGIELCATI